MSSLDKLRVVTAFSFFFSVFFAIHSMQAFFLFNSFNNINIGKAGLTVNSDQKNYSSIFKTTIQYTNSLGGVIYMSTGLIGASSIAIFAVPLA